jgi:hypothetical protein
MQQVGRLWTQRLEASYTNRSQPLPPVAKNGLDTVFGHSAALAAVQNGKGTWCLPPPVAFGSL